MKKSYGSFVTLDGWDLPASEIEEAKLFQYDEIVILFQRLQVPFPEPEWKVKEILDLNDKTGWVPRTLAEKEMMQGKRITMVGWNIEVEVPASLCSQEEEKKEDGPSAE